MIESKQSHLVPSGNSKYEAESCENAPRDVEIRRQCRFLDVFIHLLEIRTVDWGIARIREADSKNLLEFGIQESQNFGIQLNILRMEFKDL